MGYGARAARGALTVMAVIVFAACADATGPEGGARFELEVSGERFVVHVEGASQVAALEGRMASGEEGVVNGQIQSGDGGFNAPWKWHMVPSTVHTADMAIELCDGRPSLVEADLEYWLGTVKQFCPWGAKVVRRMR
ncbi:MAG: BP74-related protein [Longimicrobiales bacterium]